MSRWNQSEMAAEQSAHDPLMLERRSSLSDAEAEHIERVCLDATPGPLVLDDEADGDGAPVFSLPDGRMVVSLTAPIEQGADGEAIEANIELLSKARYWLLCLLRDRSRWQAEREELLDRLENAPAPRAPR